MNKKNYRSDKTINPTYKHDYVISLCERCGKTKKIDVTFFQSLVCMDCTQKSRKLISNAMEKASESFKEFLGLYKGE